MRMLRAHSRDTCPPCLSLAYFETKHLTDENIFPRTVVMRNPPSPGASTPAISISMASHSRGCTRKRRGNRRRFNHIILKTFQQAFNNPARGEEGDRRKRIFPALRNYKFYRVTRCTLKHEARITMAMRLFSNWLSVFKLIVCKALEGASNKERTFQG